MEYDPMHWAPASFFRKPEWRLLRAEYLIATGRQRDPRIDDVWVAHTKMALTGRGSRRSKAHAIRAARCIRVGDRDRKGELDARLLTMEPLAVIAERLGLPLAVAEAYAEVFFAVRSKRRAADWLLSRAVGFSAVSGFTSPLPWSGWKLAALAGGSTLLDVVIATTTDRPMPNSFIKQVGAWRPQEDIRLRVRVWLWLASLAAITDEQFAAVLRARRQFCDLDTGFAGPTAPVSPPVVGLEAILAGEKWRRRRSASPVAAEEVLRDLRGVVMGANSGFTALPVPPADDLELMDNARVPATPVIQVLRQAS